MKRRYLAFDIETAKALDFRECDWRVHRPLGISCAATIESDNRNPVIWHGGRKRKAPADWMSQLQAQKLVAYLTGKVASGYTIVTWNGVGFDFDVLAEESKQRQRCKRLARGHVDMMFHAVCKIGHGISLNAAAKGMCLPGKPHGCSGALVPQLWAAGLRDQVLEYVEQDVRMTLNLAEKCEEFGFLCWETATGRKRKMDLPNGWLNVRSAEKLPKSKRSWLSAQWNRDRFTGWIA